MTTRVAAVAIVAAGIAAAVMAAVIAVIAAVAIAAAVVRLGGLRLLGALLRRLCGRLLSRLSGRCLCLRLGALIVQRILDGRALFFADAREIIGSLELVAFEDIQNDFAIRVELFGELVNSVFGH